MFTSASVNRLRHLGFRTLAILAILTCSAFIGRAVFAGSSGASTPPTLTSLAVQEIYYQPDGPNCPAGAVRQFVAEGTYSDGSQQYLTQKVTWSSEDTTIATITANMGLSTCVAAGSTTISAKLNSVVGTAPITVTPGSLSEVLISPAQYILQTGTSQQFSATAAYGADVVQDVTSQSTWKSSNQSVATVSTSGMVTAGSTTGTTTISVNFGSRQNSTTLTVTSTPPNVGLWGPPQGLGITAINAVMLHTGKVLLFVYPLGRSGGPSAARLFDPTTNTLTDATLSFPVDVFCSGQSLMPDGRLLISGGLQDGVPPGDVGTFNSTIFDPMTNTWSQAPPMSYARWYPTTLPLADGTILTAAGTAQDGVTVQTVMETFNPKQNSWAVLPPSANMPVPNDDYPMLAVVPPGNVFYAAPREHDLDSMLYNPVAKTWSYAATLNWGPRAHAGFAVLPKSEKVYIVSGGYNTPEHPDPAVTTEMIDFSQPTLQWVYGPSMNIGRYNLNFIYLADGTLMAIGGNQYHHYDKPVMQPEIYDPVANTWTLLPPQLAGRGYHSTAVLLPDGRVLSAGSDTGTALEDTYEIYSPQYLFKGPRPSITSSPTSVQYGQKFSFSISTSASIARVALIRPTATTHGIHMDTARYVDLHYTAGAKQITATAPSASYDAPPGYYMLVIVDSNGVPSVTPFIQLQAAN